MSVVGFALSSKVAERVGNWSAMLGEVDELSVTDQIRCGAFVVTGVVLWPRIATVTPVSPTLTLI